MEPWTRRCGRSRIPRRPCRRRRRRSHPRAVLRRDEEARLHPERLVLAASGAAWKQPVEIHQARNVADKEGPRKEEVMAYKLSNGPQPLGLVIGAIIAVLLLSAFINWF